MIIDTLKKASIYRALGENLAAGLDFLTNTPDLAALPDGRIEIRGGGEVFALVQTYEPKPREQAIWEAHRKYIDIQYIAAGVEQLGYADLETMTTVHPYDEAKDFQLLEGAGQYARAAAGTFLIFYPHDAHSPGVATELPGKVKKIVVKVRV